MYNPYSLEGKTILVTGASSGIGRATAIVCSKLGANLIVTGRNEARLQETCSRLEGDINRYVVCDFQSTNELDNLISDIKEIHGLVCNAGTCITAPVQFIKEEKFKELLQVNTVSPIILLQKVLKKKLIKRGGSVVFTSSIAAMGVPAHGNSMYSASKAAIGAYIQGAALELGAKGIRVNAVCPGMIDTPLIHDGTFTDEQLEEDRKEYPLGTFGEPEDIGHAIAFLLSDAAKWVTGTNLIIDGGRTLN